MSVWNSARYHDDTWQQIARSVSPEFAISPKCLKFLEHHTDGCYDTGKAVPAGNMARLVESKRLTYADLKTPGKVKVNTALEAFLTNVEDVRYGLHGVHRFVAKVMSKGIARVELTADRKAFLETSVSLDGAASQLTPQDVAERLAIAVDLAPSTVEAMHAIEVALVKSIATSNSKRTKAHAIGEGPLYYNKVSFGNWKPQVSYFQGLVFIEDFYVGRHYVFTNSDIDALRNIFAGLGTYMFALPMFSRPGSGLNLVAQDRAQQMVNIYLKQVVALSKPQINYLVRAYDVIYHYHMSTLTKDTSDTAYNEQCKKWSDEKLEAILPLQRILDLVRGLDPHLAKELLNFHRCMASPDYDYISHLDKQKKMYLAAKMPDEFSRDSLNDVMLIYEYYMFTAFKERHGVWPGLPLNDFVNEQRYSNWPDQFRGIFLPEHVREIDITGTFAFEKHTVDYLELLKDKAICPEAVDDDMTPHDYLKISKLERSQIMEVLGKPEIEDMEDMRNGLDNLYWHTRVDDKSEAKKAAGRMFMIQGSKVRLLGSEYELSVANYVAHIPHITIGKSRGEKIASLNTLGKPPVSGDHPIPLFISFDLAKWSPRIQAFLHREIDGIWSRAFGELHVAEMSRVITEGKMYYFKHGMKFSMDKLGRDFEGLAAKRLTIFHLAVMHYAVSHLIEAGIIEKGSRFQVFIDDGLLRIERIGGWPPDLVKHVEQILDMCYKKCGLIISWDKTYMDTRWSVYLNDEMFFAAKVGLEVRALMKLNDRCDVMAPSLLDHLAFLDGRVSGSLYTGSLLYPVFMLKHFKLMHRLENLVPGGLKARHAIWSFTPTALGGLGTRSILQQSSSVSGRAYTDSLGNLKRIATRYPGFGPMINSIVNVEMASINADQSMKAPWTIRRKAPTLVHSKVSTYVELSLQKQNVLPGLTKLITSIKGGVGDAADFEVLHGARVSLIANSLVYAASRAAVFASVAAKILRGTSAISIIGIRRFIRCVFATEKNQKAVLESWN